MGSSILGESTGTAGSDSVTRSMEQPPPAPVAAAPAIETVYRHTVPVRIGHWLNAVCLFVLIMSGLQIFNAHPALYWGDRSDRDKPLLSIRPMRAANGEVRGVTTVLGHRFDTTGVLGYSDGRGRAFPAWATLPGPQWLAMGRRWHLFFAWLFVLNGLLFVAYSVVSRHFARDLLPTTRDVRDIGRVVKDHVILRRPKGDEATRYNVLQKAAYLIVIFGLAPLIVLTGLAMSPMIDAAVPWLVASLGGRQAARTVHFVACFAFVAFIAIHVFQVAITGFVNKIRSMTTGWFLVEREGAAHDA